MGSVTPYETSRGRRYRVRYRKPDHKQTDKRGFRTKRDTSSSWPQSRSPRTVAATSTRLALG